jgi:prevent-host-death family protein
MSIRVARSRLSKGANIAELKNNLSVYLKDVKNGGEVIVSERNVPFAKIVPFVDTDEYETEEQKLVAEGILAPPTNVRPLPDSFWEDKDLPNVPMDVILKVIREERDED